MAKHRIAIISDTHGLIRDEVREVLKTCEIIFHGGDINTQKIVDELGEIAPLHVVRGNNDKEWAEHIPMTVTENVAGFKFFMCHKMSDIKKIGIPNDTDFVIYGHSHKYETYEENDICYINPGSPGPRRFHQPVTMAVLTVDETDKSYLVEKIDMSPVLLKESAKGTISPKDLDKVVTLIIKDMNSGKSVGDTAKRNRVDEELVDSIYRMYSTHQGIDISGIIDRLELRNVYTK
ncbi:MAG: metallophosphoesterase family protein [Lachnospiraceae bacterium]|nr:metallophosphoesterase family protein [Lachnospiraceae bacterium]